MKRYLFHISSTVLFMLTIFSIVGCHDAPEYQNDALGNFDALADIIETRYCFLDEKGIDWDNIREKYRDQIYSETNYPDLFDVCSSMLDELKDGHVNLSSRFNTSYYRKWWTDYPQNYNLRTIQQYYLNFDYSTVSGINYKMLTEDSIGYIQYPSFSNPIGEINLDYVLAFLHNAKGLIIDVRNNGGGELTNVETLVSRFIKEPVCGGYIRHKTGPGHSDFSEPYEITYRPAPDYRIHYYGPIVVLTNRSCFSAANNFVAVMKQLPNVTIAGARTGGGGGLPFSSELPNGWLIRFSACPINGPNDETIEYGIDPTPGCEVDAPAEELAEGVDAIIDFAIATIKKATANKD